MNFLKALLCFHELDEKNQTIIGINAADFYLKNLTTPFSYLLSPPANGARLKYTFPQQQKENKIENILQLRGEIFFPTVKNMITNR